MILESSTLLFIQKLVWGFQYHMHSQSTALSLDSSSAIVDKAGLKEPGSKNSPNLYYSFKTKEKLFSFSVQI